MNACHAHASVWSVVRRGARAACGLLLVLTGETHPGFAGLLLMMLGLVPIVTAAADICLLDELRHAWRDHFPHPPHLPA